MQSRVVVICACMMRLTKTESTKQMSINHKPGFRVIVDDGLDMGNIADLLWNQQMLFRIDPRVRHDPTDGRRIGEGDSAIVNNQRKSGGKSCGNIVPTCTCNT